MENWDKLWKSSQKLQIHASDKRLNGKVCIRAVISWVRTGKFRGPVEN